VRTRLAVDEVDALGSLAHDRGLTRSAGDEGGWPTSEELRLERVQTAGGVARVQARFVPQTSVYLETHGIGPLARSSSIRRRPRWNASSEISLRPEKTFSR
jgi:hypothetical protein